MAIKKDATTEKQERGFVLFNWSPVQGLQASTQSEHRESKFVGIGNLSVLQPLSTDNTDSRFEFIQELKTLRLDTRYDQFAFLDDFSADRVIGGIYYAIRLIKHRDSIRASREGYIVDDSMSEPSDADRKLALEMIEAVEGAECMPLDCIGRQVANEYISRLASIVEKLIEKDVDRTRGQQLLGELRKG